MKAHSDQFDTPFPLAEALVAASRQECPLVVADFAAGQGMLLNSAARRWPSASLVANDICGERVSLLKDAHPDWQVEQVDFLDPASCEYHSPILKHKKAVSVVLLNPPFSCRGASKISVDLGGTGIACSPAVAFVLSSVPYIAPCGEIVAILPAGSLDSMRDEKAWSYLRRLFEIEIISSQGRDAFDQCSVRTATVRFTRLSHGELQEEISGPPAPESPCPDGPLVSVLRGKLQMHRVPEVTRAHGTPLVHTTELRENRVVEPHCRVPRRLACLKGPAVLIPRVGEPSVSKVALLGRPVHLALSDCVIGLQCGTNTDAHRLHSTLLANWQLLERLYTGTCARFVRVSSVERLLGELGFRTEKGASTSLTPLPATLDMKADIHTCIEFSEAVGE
jgi:hypothetical protein